MSCKSMTGFGRAVFRGDSFLIKAELRAVNHRFAEFNIKLPREWSALEESIRNVLAQQIHRGRVDVFLSGENLQPAQRRVTVDWGLLDALTDAEKEVALRYTPGTQVNRTVDWFIYPDVLRIETDEVNVERLRADVLLALEQALETFLDMRSREGQRLRVDMVMKLSTLRKAVQMIEELAPEAHLELESRLRKRVSELATAVDEQRIMTEIAILLERQTIDEELVRLKSHIDECCEALSQGSPVGRKLDFLIQEMHREINTIGSKANHLIIAKAVVDAKVVIEQLREQTQNLE